MKVLYLDCSWGLTAQGLLEALGALGDLPPCLGDCLDSLALFEMTDHSLLEFWRGVDQGIQDSDLPADVKALTLALSKAWAKVVLPSPQRPQIVQGITLAAEVFLRLQSLEVQLVRCSSVALQSSRWGAPQASAAMIPLLQGLSLCPGGKGTDVLGLLVLRQLSPSFGPMPEGTFLALGSAQGSPLKAWLFSDGVQGTYPYLPGKVAVLESNLDDMNPQDYGPLMARLFDGGALDVFLTPVIMKKNRPGVRLTCIGPPELKEDLARIVLKFSTTIGLRWRLEDRITLRRVQSVFPSSWGDVSFKTSLWGSEVLQETPEFEDLQRLSIKTGIPLPSLRNQVMAEYLQAKGQGREGRS